jgi:proteasome lid subunit RPN8/RPN11/LysM repeat protein
MNIEIKENSQELYTRSELPFDSVFAGSEGDDEGIGIYIRQSTLRKIEEYLSGDKSNELGGVLVGEVCETSSGEKFIKIENMIFAMHASSSLSRLTFTHETWDYINKELEDEHQGKKIVGWFHSHPGHTVFMSSHDIFIHENFFNISYMVAYVFDPTIKERGFFKWRENGIVRASGFHIYDNDGGDKIHEILKNDEKTVDLLDASDEKKIRSGKIDILKSVLVALSLFSFLLTAFLAYNFIDVSKKLNVVSELREEVSQLKARLDAVAPVIAGERKNPAAEERKVTSTAKDTAVKQKELTIDNSKANTETVKSSTSNSTTNTTAADKTQSETQKSTTKTEVKKYTIKKGDTLEKIAIANYGSRDGIEILMKHNNIVDKAAIKIGQTIEIPQKN